MPAPTAPPRSLWRTLLVVGLLLAATADERLLGSISDEQQMLSTALAVAERGEIGIARGQFFMVKGAHGDAVSPYGMGFPLLAAPVMRLARPWSRVFGSRSAQTLLVALQVLFVASGAAGAALLARELGAGRWEERLAAIGTALGSPLWAYTGTAYSEPLQAAALVFALLFAARAARRNSTSAAVVAGFCAGYAVLTKSVLLLVLPFMVAPLLLNGDDRYGSRFRRLVAWGGGAFGPLLTWLVFEVSRFGYPLASYGGQTFSHPVIDGLWRLLVGANKGLLLFFPLLAVAIVQFIGMVRRRESPGTLLGIAGCALVQLLLASCWWAWDGTFGWGPRLVVAAIPSIAAVAARARLWWLIPAVVVGSGVNALGVFMPDAAARVYVSSIGPVPVEQELATRYPSYFVTHDSAGRAWLPRDFVTPLDAAFSPLRTHAFLLRMDRTGGREESRQRLGRAPWLAQHPEATPRLVANRGTIRAAAIGVLTAELRWPHLGAVLITPPDERWSTFVGAYEGALIDQTYRLLDAGEAAAARGFAERLFDLSPTGLAVALRAESLRVSGDSDRLGRFLAALSPEERQAPNLKVVLALMARAAGDEVAARQLVMESNESFPLQALRLQLARPVAEWPTDLHSMVSTTLVEPR